MPTSSRFGTIEDFVAASRETPLNMTIAGIATSHHMAGLALENGAGL